MFSLEKLCLSVIVQNFERFYFVFSVSKENSPQLRNLEFLQRRYSAELAIALYEGKYLKAEYLTLLINEHLKFLDGNWFKYGHCFNSMEEIFCHLPNLTSIHFLIEGNDEVLKNVAKFCPKIVEIDIRHSQVTDKGIMNLCDIKNGTVPCPELKNLLITCSCVTDRGVETLIRNLPSLEKIAYPKVSFVLYSIYRECLSGLQKVPFCHLVELDISELTHTVFYTDMLKACLTVCPKLESLICCITNTEQLHFFNNNNLKKLDLSFYITNPTINIDNFLKVSGHNWTNLKIFQCSLSLSALAVSCPVLKELLVIHVHFTDKDDEYVQVIFPSLIKCSFCGRQPRSDRGFTLLLSSPKLESLSFSFFELSDEKKKHQILQWCKRSSSKKISFLQLKLEIKFLRDILLNSLFLQEMCLIRCHFDVPDVEEILNRFAGKPKISFIKNFA